jgi:hypothetical protein
MKDFLVVYIIADNRSGSTLLDYLLSCHPDAISVGELHHFQEYYYKRGWGKRNNWKCSCNKQFQDCKFWTDISEKLNVTEEFVTKLPRRKGGILNKFFLKNGLEKRIKQYNDEDITKAFASNMWQIYESIFEKTGKKIIIDSSKNLYEAYFLNKFKKGDIAFINLERNVWEVAHSKANRMKTFSTELKEYMNLHERSIYKEIAASYRIKRLNSLLVGKLPANKVQIVDYQNLTTHVSAEITKLCRFLGISTFIPPERTDMGNEENHSIHGSPSRKVSRLIAPDDKWKEYYKKRPLAYLFARCLG